MVIERKTTGPTLKDYFRQYPNEAIEFSIGQLVHTCHFFERDYDTFRVLAQGIVDRYPGGNITSKRMREMWDEYDV